jgi:hypothetical protein
MLSRYASSLTGVPVKDAAQAAANIRSFGAKANEYNLLNDAFKQKFGIEVTEAQDSRGIVAKRMIKEGTERTAKGKDGSIKVYGNPTNQNTCAAGVCTIAANAGVDFSKMKGTIASGLATDDTGRKIPQYNPLIMNQLDQAGYYEVPKEEAPQEGDLVQYFSKSDAGAMTPTHLEFITGKDKDGYKTFNNYGLFNYGEGEGKFIDNRKGGQITEDIRTTGANRVYRLKPEAADAAVGKDGIEMLSKSKGVVNELNSIRDTALQGEDRSTFGIIFSGIRNNQSKDQVLKNALRTAKDKQFVTSVIEELYKK